MRDIQLEIKTTKLMLHWMKQHYSPISGEDYWDYGDDIGLVERGMIQAANFLIDAGCLKNIGETETHEHKLQIINPSEASIPPLEEAFPYFNYFGCWYGFYIDHPYEGFVVENKLETLFENLIKLELCNSDGSFYF